MRVISLLAATILGVIFTTAPAQGLTIKIGSLAPVGSPWELGLKRMAAEWERLSAGQLQVKIYPGGVSGDEADMVRKMRIGTLNGALITAVGLQGVFNGVKTLSYPMLLRSDGELSFVLDKMKPTFDREIQKRGFKPVMWSIGGWLYFFSRYPVVTPDDLRRQKLWVWGGDPDETLAFQRAGFQTVHVDATEMTTSLQDGMVDAFATSPLIAASNQWFGIASNMCTLKLGTLWGAIIVSEKTWAAIPVDLQPRLTTAAQEIFDVLLPDALTADTRALTVMKRYGLKINTVTPQAETAWAEQLQKTFSGLVGTVYDREMLAKAAAYLEEYLADHPRMAEGN
jgi:TRAP-type transport system periplasmic protein